MGCEGIFRKKSAKIFFIKLKYLYLNSGKKNCLKNRERLYAKNSNFNIVHGRFVEL